MRHAGSSPRIRVLLADDHTIVRQGVRLCLEALGDMEVVAEAANGLEAVAMVDRLHPDVAVVDLTMPELSGVEAIRRIRASHPSTGVVVLSVHETDAYVVQALKAGAAGYVPKKNAATDLAEAIRAAHAGQAYLHPSVARGVLDDYLSRLRPDAGDGSGPWRDSGRAERLTAREREVLRRAAEGASTKEIADQLGLSVRTVEHHRSSGMAKLGLKGQTELVKFAIRTGLVEPL